MTTVEVLKAAREKIADEENFEIGSLARSATGRQVKPWSPRAVCWCAEGAIRSVGRSEAYSAIESIERNNAIPSLWQFNDEHTHAEVIALFGKAIAAEETKAA